MAGTSGLAAAIAALLEFHGVGSVPGRAEKLAAALAPLLERSAADTIDDPPEYRDVSASERWQP